MQVSRIESAPLVETLPCIWVTEFELESTQRFCQSIFKFESDPTIEEIFVYISSPGGMVYSCFGMIDAMVSCSKPVNTIVMGIGASAGAALAICGTGKRFITSNSFLHIHFASGAVIGDVPSMEVGVGHAKVLNSRMIRMMADKSNLTKAELLRMIKDSEKEWQVSAKDAVKYGFADIIGTPKFTQSTIISADF